MKPDHAKAEQYASEMSVHEGTRLGNLARAYLDARAKLDAMLNDTLDTIDDVVEMMDEDDRKETG